MSGTISRKHFTTSTSHKSSHYNWVWVATKKLGPICSAVLTLLDTSKQTDNQSIYLSLLPGYWGIFLGFFYSGGGAPGFNDGLIIIIVFIGNSWARFTYWRPSLNGSWWWRRFNPRWCRASSSHWSSWRWFGSTTGWFTSWHWRYNIF